MGLIIMEVVYVFVQLGSSGQYKQQDGDMKRDCDGLLKDYLNFLLKWSAYGNGAPGHDAG